MSINDFIIVSTRPAAQQDDFIIALQQAGFATRALPTLTVVPAYQPDTAEIITRFHRGLYQWVIFSSVNGVRLFRALFTTDEASSSFDQVKVAVQGHKTNAAVLDAFGRNADFIASDGVSDTMAQELLALLSPQVPTLYVTATGSRFVIRDTLLAAGIPLTVLITHTTAAVLRKVDEFYRDATGKKIIITFFSPSAFEAFCTQVSEKDRCKFLYASIGPVTTRAILSKELTVCVEASAPDGHTLVSDLKRYCSEST